MRGAGEGWSLAHLTGTRKVLLSHKRECVCVGGVWVVIIVQALFPWLSVDFSLVCHGEPRKTCEVWTDGFRAVF